jgi:hypothetical protein
MEPEVSLLTTVDTATGPYPEPSESDPHLQTVSAIKQFWIVTRINNLSDVRVTTQGTAKPRAR